MVSQEKNKKKKISKSFEHCFLVKSNTDHSAKKKKKNKQKCKCAEHYNNKWKCDSIKCSDALL